MADQRLEAAGDAGGVARDAELLEDGELVEVDPLADQAVLLEDEEGEDRQLVLPPRRGQAAQRAPVGSPDDRLDHHAVVGVMERAQLVPLVREGAPALLEVGAHLLGPVVDLAGGDQLVARVVEGVEGGAELMPVLGLHVLEDDRLSLLAHCGSRWHAATYISTAMLRSSAGAEWVSAPTETKSTPVAAISPTVS